MRKIITAIAGFLVLCACSTVNCPLNNVVYVRFSMVDTLKDSLTVFTVLQDGTNDTVINKQINTKTLKLPMSYSQSEDVWVFSAKDTIQKVVINDTIHITKTDQPHFESVDCGPAFFHTLTGANCTKHLMENVTITNEKVDYDATKTHLQIHYGTRY